MSRKLQIYRQLTQSCQMYLYVELPTSLPAYILESGDMDQFQPLLAFRNTFMSLMKKENWP